MTRRSTTPQRRSLRLLAATAAAAFVFLLLVLQAHSDTAATQGCPLRIAAFEDGSARLYCGGTAEPIGHIDAESGRVRLGFPDHH